VTTPTATALAVLKAGQCSASCLLGETTRCGCRCGGLHHGELLATLTRQAGTPISPPRRGTKGPR